MSVLELDRPVTTLPLLDGLACSPPASSGGPVRNRTDEQLSQLGHIGVEELVRRHDDALHRFCRRISPNAEEAADAVQATWERAFVTFAKHGSVQKIRPWLYTVARNECLDRMKSRGAAPTVDVDDIEIAGGVTPDEAAEGRAALDLVFRDLADLSERQRSALVLRELSGFGADEIAATLQTTPTLALGLVADARRNLSDRRAGRALPCDRVRTDLQRMRRRTAGAQAHLAACAGCRSFEQQRRGRALSARVVAPILPWLSLLQRLAGSAPGGPRGVAAAVAAAATASLSLGAVSGLHDTRPAQTPTQAPAIEVRVDAHPEGAGLRRPTPRIVDAARPGRSKLVAGPDRSEGGPTSAGPDKLEVSAPDAGTVAPPRPGARAVEPAGAPVSRHVAAEVTRAVERVSSAVTTTPTTVTRTVRRPLALLKNATTTQDAAAGRTLARPTQSPIVPVRAAGVHVLPTS